MTVRPVLWDIPLFRRGDHQSERGDRAGKGYNAADGSSKMPSYNDSMLVQEVIDLVAYLSSLKPVGAVPAGHRGH
jgi:hypothetical protein